MRNAIQYVMGLVCALWAFAQGRKIARWIFLDYDDTMAPTEACAMRISYQMWKELMEEMGLTLVFDEDTYIRRNRGKTFSCILEESRQDHGLSLTDLQIADLVIREKDAVIEGLRHTLKGTQGAVEMLKAMIVRNIGLAVVSSSDIARLRACLEATGQHELVPANRVYSAQSSLPAPAPKPRPDVYFFAITACEATTDECLAVEDSLSGVRAAKAAGLFCVGFVGLAEDRKLAALELLAAGADVIIDELPEVIEVVRLRNWGMSRALNNRYRVPWQEAA